MKHIFLTFSFFILISCSNIKKFDGTLNTIEAIKKNNQYGEIILTIKEFKSNALNSKQEIIAGYIYKNKEASIKIICYPKEHILNFERIDERSDHYVYAIAQLFEEPHTKDIKMKSVVACTISSKGDHGNINFLDKTLNYEVIYYPNLDHKIGRAILRMRVDLDKKQVMISEKYGGLVKQNFVNAFKQ
ncbi:MAG: hypothetical protein ACPGTO_03115 [Polaribacter sp.]